MGWRRLLPVALLAGLTVPAAAESPTAAAGRVALSPELTALLRAEMQALSTGVQTLAAAIAIGAWPEVARTGEAMADSYIMTQRLTPAQERALAAGLPEGFKRLDARLHRQAEQLVAAARAGDPELVAFRYARMIETCVACHGEFAADRFPALAPPADAAH